MDLFFSDIQDVPSRLLTLGYFYCSILCFEYVLSVTAHRLGDSGISSYGFHSGKHSIKSPSRMLPDLLGKDVP